MKGITEFAFEQWANSPKSTHPNDLERFYRFVKTMKRYRCIKYKDYNHFREYLKECENNKLSDEEIKCYFDKMNEFLNYDEAYAYSFYDFIFVKE